MKFLLPFCWVIISYACTNPSSTGTSSPPNFLVIYTDDQRYDALGWAGNDNIITPNLDRLCQQGMYFSNAFVTLSICSPSRAALLTGLYGSENGVTRVGNVGIDSSIQTVAQLLQRNNYRTAMIGKWHLSNTPQQLGFEQANYFMSNGSYYNRNVKEGGREIKISGFIEDYNADQAIDYLKQQGQQQPFFLFYCTQLPHMDHQFDWNVQEQTLARYASLDLKIPPNREDDLKNKPPYLANERSRQRGNFYGYRNDDSLRNHLLRYRAAITEMDASVGRILSYLEESGLSENTYIFFMGDNGWFIGEHGFTSKVLPYEESIRVPFAVAGPTVTPGQDNHLVLNIDIAPTMLALAGVNPLAEQHGRSLLPLLHREPAEWRESIYYHAPEPQLGSWPLEAIRTQDWKYIRTYDIDDPQRLVFEELYHLRDDPYELNNLVATDFTPASRLTYLRIRLDSLKSLYD